MRFPSLHDTTFTFAPDLRRLYPNVLLLWTDPVTDPHALRRVDEIVAAGYVLHRNVGLRSWKLAGPCTMTWGGVERIADVGSTLSRPGAPWPADPAIPPWINSTIVVNVDDDRPVRTQGHDRVMPREHRVDWPGTDRNKRSGW